MRMVMAGGNGRASRVARVWAFHVAWLVCGCADVLGIPPDPQLVPPDELLAEPTDASVQGAGVAQEPTLSPNVPSDAPDAGSGADGLGSDGVLPPGNVTGIGGSLAPDASANGPGEQQPEPPAEVKLDAGALGGDAAAPPVGAQGCTGLLGRVPVDVVLVFDNSGSMVAEAAALEAALPEFAARLDRDEVDYRIILLSRHRDAERESSEEASTSVCIDAPLGVGPCPSESPVPTERFFQYSIKIDATDSFARFIESFSEPDRFGLVQSGWSERLRPDARKVIIEISDADSSVSVSAFLDALVARDSLGLLTAAGRPNFVFHSIVGLAPKRIALAVYDANEPIESSTCGGDGGAPDNAGERYQALSRLSGGARLPLCPPSLLGARMQLLATDVALRSVRLCPLDD
jgi:hypothetical protein